MRYDIYNLLYDYFKGCDCPNYYIEDILKTNYSDYQIEKGKLAKPFFNKELVKKEDYIYVRDLENDRYDKPFDVARFGSTHPSCAFYSRAYCVDSDLFIEDLYGVDDEESYVFCVFKNFLEDRFLAKYFADKSCPDVDAINNAFCELNIDPDAMITIECKRVVGKCGDTYTLKSYVDDMKLIDEKNSFSVLEDGRIYYHSSTLAKAKYNELIKPLLDLPMEERQVAMADKIAFRK